MQDAVQSITAAPNSGQGQSQARALAASWCKRLLDQNVDAHASDIAISTSEVSGSLGEDAAVAEAEVAELAVASGDDVSHFRNLLRKARSAKDAAEAAAQLLEADKRPGPGAQRVQAAKQSAKRARAALSKWLLGVAESAVVAA